LKQAIITQNKHWKQKYENLFFRDVVDDLIKKITFWSWKISNYL